MRILQRKSVERGAVGKREETKKVNSSAFNDIIRAYCKLALNDAGVDEKLDRIDYIDSISFCF